MPPMLFLHRGRGRSCLALLVLVTACGQKSIPGGLDEAQLFEGAVDARLSESGVAFIEQEADELLRLLSPARCGRPQDLSCPQGFRLLPGGASDPHRCSASLGRCVEASTGVPGPILGFQVTPARQSGIDVCYDATGGSSPPECATWLRLERGRVRNRRPNRLEIGLTTQLFTTAIPVRADFLGSDIVCEVSLDSYRSGSPTQDIEADLRVDGYAPPTGGPPRGLRVFVDAVRASIQAGDIDVRAPPGSGVADMLACGGLGLVRGVLVDQVVAALRGLIQDQLDEALAQPCSLGCGSGEVCGGGICLDQNGVPVPRPLGFEGRFDLTSLLGLRHRVSAIDLSLSVGPGARVDASGVGLAGRGGVAVAAASQCAPGRPSPRSQPGFGPTPPLSSDDRADLDFDGIPETDYMLALGLSEALIDHLSWAIEQSGLLCAEVDERDVALLNTSALSLLIPSLSRLTGADLDPTAVFPARASLRAPGFTLELGTGELKLPPSGGGAPKLITPLVTAVFTDLELSLAAVVEGRWVRLFTSTFDLRLDLGAFANRRNEIEFVVGDLAGAIKDVRIEPSALLTEPPSELQLALPALLELALPEVLKAVPPIELPGPGSLGGLRARLVGIRGVGGGPSHAVAYLDFSF